MTEMVQEVEPRLPHAMGAPLEYEERVTDLAIEALRDVRECDGAHVCVKWINGKVIPGKTVPLLYVYFAHLVGDDSMPRVHVDELGEIRPAHAVCLATVPSGNLITDPQKVRDLVRQGVERFLLQFHVRSPKLGDKMTLSRH